MSDNKHEKKKEKVNVRKYVNFVLLMIAIVLVAFIGYKLYVRYEENKLSESVFTRMGGTIQYDDIKSVMSEMATDGFILVSYTKNEDVKKMESKLKKSIVNHELQSNFYYLDATELMLEEDYIDLLNTEFGLEENDIIKGLPAILYYKDGAHMKTLTSTESRMLTVDDFNMLLDNYEIVERE